MGNLVRRRSWFPSNLWSCGPACAAGRSAIRNISKHSASAVLRVRLRPPIVKRTTGLLTLQAARGQHVRRIFRCDRGSHERDTTDRRLRPPLKHETELNMDMDTFFSETNIASLRHLALPGTTATDRTALFRVLSKRFINAQNRATHRGLAFAGRVIVSDAPLD